MALSTRAFSSRTASTSSPTAVHREDRGDLQQMILNDVADGAGLFVEASAPSHAERFGHRDLNTLDIMAVPQRLEQRIGETEIEEVLDRLFAEEVIDTKDGRFGEHSCTSSFSARADARSRPNGFSSATRASATQLARENPVTTAPKAPGGMAR